MTQLLDRVRSWNRWIIQAQLWKNAHAQDLVEYSLMAGFVAVSAGAIMPGVANSISTVFSKVASVMTRSASQGS
jgi:Flp pilus assembly pilin Flp